MKVLVSIFLLFFAVYGCGSDSPSTPTGQQPVVDDSDDHPDVDDDPDTGDIDITDAIFTKRDGSCTDYASMYVSDVKDAQSGTSFAGDGFPIFGSCINDGKAPYALPAPAMSSKMTAVPDRMLPATPRRWRTWIGCQLQLRRSVPRGLRVCVGGR